MEHEMTIRSLAYGGDGVGDIDGKVCFIPGALPGETVRVRIKEDKKKYLRARIIDIVSPSPERETPPCPFYGPCGGCQYQHMNYATELYWKEEQVRSQLSRMAGIEPSLIKPIVASPKPYAYRNQVTLHFKQRRGSGEVVAGFIGTDNRSIIRINQCPIADTGLQAAFDEMATLNKMPSKKDLTYRLAADREIIRDDTDRLFTVSVNGKDIITHSRSFFQNNLAVIALIAGKTGEWLQEAAPRTFFDLYAGVGTFSLLAAGKIPHIICIEGNKPSLEALHKNLDTLEADTEIIHGKVEKAFAERLSKDGFEEPAAVFVDPPRTGLDAKAVAALTGKRPGRTLIYLSCHIGTLARDLKALTEHGAYTLQEAVPFDMFPQTKHIEVLCLLKRREENT